METALIFAGGDPLPSWLVNELPESGLVVAADGGYDQAVRLGFRVDVLVGDMDSIVSTGLPQHVLVERHPVDKDASDLELALELVCREHPDRVVVAGGAGGRLDHELANAGLLCSPRWEPIEEIDWLSSRGSGHVVRGRRILHGDQGETVTLVPFGGDAVGVSTKGLKWELRDETLPAGTTRGVSNVLNGPVVEIAVTSGCLLALVSVTD